MIGIAISLYDKFDDVRLLVDIIRENWEKEYYISICCNHPDAEAKLDGIDADSIEQGAQIAYSPEMDGQRGHVNLMCRVHDTFRRACQNAVEAECEYVVHNHADAWMLSENRFQSLVTELRQKNRKAAVRGWDPTYRRPGFWMGHPMDQYIVFDAKYCEEISFFDFSPLELLPHTTNHTGLMLLLLGRIGLSNIWFYSDRHDDQWWDNREKHIIHGVRTAIYVPEWEYLHVATESFPDDYGKHIQAGYLRSHGLTNGAFIEEFLSEYDKPLSAVNDELRQIEREQNKRLQRLGFQKEDIGRKFIEKRKRLDSPLSEKLKMLARNVASEGYYGLMQAIHRFPLAENRRFTGHRSHRKLYRDVEWPQNNINELYSEVVTPSDYPPDVRDIWFSDYENTDE